MIRKRMLLLPLLLLTLLTMTACGDEDEYSLRGQVTEVVLGPDGLPDALVLDTGNGELERVFWDEETQWALPPAAESFSRTQVWEDPVGMEVSVHLRLDAEGNLLTAQDGTEFPDAGTADFLTVEEIRSSESLTLSDGTQAEIWVGFWNDRSYRLSDGTELLRERPQDMDFSTYYVEGNTPLTVLPAALLEGITAYYQERGALYDIQTEVEKAYQAYQKSEDPERFSSFLVEQRVGWAATAPGVYYFHTTLILPVREQEITEHWFTDAFDKETGEHIPCQDLFSVGQAEAAEAVVAGTEAIGQEARAMREQFQWSYLNFDENSLSVWYPAGTLPGREYSSGWSLDYRSLKDVLHPWAVPEAPEP